jgi:hypothetical protein
MRNAKLIGLTLCSILSAAAAAHAQRGTIVRIDPRLLIARCHVSVPAPRRGANGSAVPGDYDGDGVMDVAEKRDDGEWSIDYAANGLVVRNRPRCSRFADITDGLSNTFLVGEKGEASATWRQPQSYAFKRCSVCFAISNTR